MLAFPSGGLAIAELIVVLAAGRIVGQIEPKEASNENKVPYPCPFLCDIRKGKTMLATLLATMLIRDQKWQAPVEHGIVGCLEWRMSLCCNRIIS